MSAPGLSTFCIIHSSFFPICAISEICGFSSSLRKKPQTVCAISHPKTRFLHFIAALLFFANSKPIGAGSEIRGFHPRSYITRNQSAFKYTDSGHVSITG